MAEFAFPASRYERTMALYLALRKDFSELAGAILEASRESRHGVTLTIEPIVMSQTNPQRGYYHKWKNAFADFCGSTPDEMHEHLLCETYGSEMVDTRLGLVRRPLKRSSVANRVEYSVLIDTLIRVAADMGFFVPPPVHQAEEHEHESEG